MRCVSPLHSDGTTMLRYARRHHVCVPVKEKEEFTVLSVKEKFKNNPLLYYALSICATWAGIGSLMNGVVMTQKLGVIPSLIWVLGNTFACILFGYIALRIPKAREVFRSKAMLWICGIMWAVGVTIAALYHSAGHYNTISMGLSPEPMREGIWKAILLLPGPFTYPYFFRILDYNEKNEDGTAKVDVQKAFTLGGIFFGIYMAIIFGLAWAQFTPVLNLVKAILITIIGTSTLSSAMYSIYIAFGKKLGLLINAGLIIGWHILIPLGVMGMWTLMASVRIYFVVGAILFALFWDFWEEHKEAWL